MSEVLSRSEMKDYLEEWSPAENSTMTTNGFLICISSYDAANEVSALFKRYGYVIDQIHWEAQHIHIVPMTEVDDE